MSGTSTQITLSPATLAENLRRVTIGQLAANDPDPGDILTFSVTDRRFAVEGTTLKLVSNFFDFEKTPVYQLAVTVTDQAGNVFTQDVPIAILDVNEAPVFTGGATALTIRENGLPVTTYSAADPDAGATLRFSIAGGFDGNKFTIDAITGELAFKAEWRPDFENRRDNNGDNVYNVVVGVSDGGLTATRELDVRIADQLEDGQAGRLRARIDFAPDGSNTADGFLIDTGAAFGLQRGFGWITEASLTDGQPGAIPDSIADIPGAIYERPDPTDITEERVRTVANFASPDAPGTSAQRWAWEHEVRNGWYQVRVAIGDTAGDLGGPQGLNIEGVNVVDGFQATATLRGILQTVVVEVTDGRLTLDAIGYDNTKVQSIRFEELPKPPSELGFFLEALAVTGSGAPVEIAGATGINPNASLRIDVGGADPVDPIRLSTINSGTVKLREELSGTMVEGTVNTDAVGGTISFQPNEALKANTAYTFVIDGVRTESGEEFVVSTATFATGPSTVAGDRDVAFAREEMAVSAETPYSSLAISPDGEYLYATSLAGTITRWRIDDATGALTNEQVWTVPALEGRALIGLAFDPENPDVLWITNNDPLGRAAAEDFTGKISRVTIADGAAFNATIEDYVVGLPRSIRDHLANSLAFHQDETGDWKLYMTQGSNSATGAPDNSWGLRPERLLSGAVLEIDPDRNVSAGPIDVQTQDPAVVLPSGAGAQVGFYNPFAPNAPVQLFATGVRNAYDLVWHSNGHLYVPTNGSAASGNTPDDPSTVVNEALEGIGAQNDYLFDVREGFYYGHPNPVRGEYVLSGGNPTAGDDGPDEIAADSRYPGYPVGVLPEANYGGYAYNFSVGRSPNGAVEYLGDYFGDALAGALLVVEYSGGKDIVAIRFDANGNVIEEDGEPFALGDARGNTLRFANPLDLATSANGFVYVLQLSSETGGAITLLRPTDRDPTPPPPQILEAELAALTASLDISTTAPEFSGTGYVRFSASPSSGETISWTFNVAQAGIYEVAFGYSLALNSRTVDGRPLALAVNGEDQESIPFLPSGASQRDWAEALVSVMLSVGVNTITLTSTGSSGPNVDYLEIPALPLAAVNTRPVIDGEQADIAFVVGTPISFVLDDITVADVDPGDAASVFARLRGGGDLPPWLDFDPGTNQFSSNTSAVPTPGIYEIELIARDLRSGTSVEVITFALQIVRDVDPANVDGDGQLNAPDADDDNDGVADVADPFQSDPTNGMGTAVGEGRRLVFDFDDVPFGADPGYALGITGLHLSGGRTPEQLGLGSPNLSIGGGRLHIENAGSGDLATGNLTLGAQFGIDPVARLYRISATFDHAFDSRAPARGINYGLLIGTGASDTYVKFVLEGRDANNAFLQMETRVDGTRIDASSPSFGRTTGAIYRAADANDTVTFTFDIDQVAGTLTASWSLRNGADLITGTAPTITLTGELLDAIRGEHTITTGGGTEISSGLSVGVVASSRNAANPLDVDVLEIVVEGFVSDPDIVVLATDTPLLPDRAVFNFIRVPSENTGPPGENPPREFKDTAIVTIRNDGNDTLNVTGIEFDGPFRAIAGGGAFALLPGQSRDVTVEFDSRPQSYDPEVDPELFTGIMRVLSDDPDEPISEIDLAGFYQVVPEGGQEPNFNELMEVFGFGTRADRDRFDNFGLYERAGRDEILSPYWRIAEGYTEVTVTQLAAFHDIQAASILIYEVGNDLPEDSQVVVAHDSVYNQAVLPLTRGTLDLPTATFGADDIDDAWGFDGAFGFRVAGQFSDPRLNPKGGPEIPVVPGQQGHFVRFYVAKDEAGNVIEDTYLVAQDYLGSNFDYQDNLYLVRGIEAALDLAL